MPDFVSHLIITNLVSTITNRYEFESHYPYLFNKKINGLSLEGCVRK
jgi:hypothetical protein